MVQLIAPSIYRQVQSRQRPPQFGGWVDLGTGVMVDRDGYMAFTARNPPRFLPLPPLEDSPFKRRKTIQKCVAAGVAAVVIYSLAQRFLCPESLDEKILISLLSGFCSVAVTAVLFRPTQPQEVFKKIALSTGIAVGYLFLKRSYCWLRS